MEFLETSRSARKFEPSRTARYRRADPRATNVVLGYDRDTWETTTAKIQKQVSDECLRQSKMLLINKKMTNSRKRGMLSSSLSFGNEVNTWSTESTNYAAPDLKTWGPRSTLQRDSYSWTDKERIKLQALQQTKNAPAPANMKFDQYFKLPPIGSTRNGSGTSDENIAPE